MVNRLLFEKTDNGWIQLFRYSFVGGVAFVVDFGLLWLLTDRCGLHYAISATISFIAGLTVNYLVSVRWIFRKHILNKRIVEFIIYGTIGVVGLGLNVVIIWIFTELLRIHYLLSKIVSTAIVLIWNFTARRFILFSDEKRNR